MAEMQFKQERNSNLDCVQRTAVNPLTEAGGGGGGGVTSPNTPPPKNHPPSKLRAPSFCKNAYFYVTVSAYIL